MGQTQCDRHALLKYYFGSGFRDPSTLYHGLDEQAFVIALANNHGGGEETMPVVDRHQHVTLRLILHAFTPNFSATLYP